MEQLLGQMAFIFIVNLDRATTEHLYGQAGLQLLSNFEELANSKSNSR
jgi:hypothetical protein